MINIRWYKVLNDLAGNKTRTLLIVLSMAVGLFAVGVILSARSILSRGLAESFAAINPSTGVVRTGETFDEQFLASVRSMHDVQAADARRNLAARIEIAPDEWKNISIFVVPDYNEIQVNKIEPDTGAWPPPEREILIERAALQVIHAQVGDTVRIKLANDTIREMKISGTAYDPAQMPAQLDGTPYGYVSTETLDWLGESFGFNELYVIASNPEDEEWSRQVVNQVKDKAERIGLTIPMTMTAEPGQLPMDDILQAILAFIERFSGCQHGLSSAGAAETSDRCNEGYRWKFLAAPRNVPCHGHGVRCIRPVAGHPAGYLRSPGVKPIHGLLLQL